MAGTIIIGANNLMDVNTRTFDLLVERIRPHLDADAPDVLSKAYWAMDEGAMTYISLKELSDAQFQQFVRAAKLAQEAYRSNSTGAYSTAWVELIDRLQLDPRGA